MSSTQTELRTWTLPTERQETTLCRNVLCFPPLLGTKGIPTRSKKLLGALLASLLGTKGIATRSKKLLGALLASLPGAKGIATRSKDATRGS